MPRPNRHFAASAKRLVEPQATKHKRRDGRKLNQGHERRKRQLVGSVRARHLTYRHREPTHKEPKPPKERLKDGKQWSALRGSHGQSSLAGDSGSAYAVVGLLTQQVHPQLASEVRLLALLEHNVIRPGKPVDNAFAESFNSRIRDEFLNQHSFRSFAHARNLGADWREDYNTMRPHTSLVAVPSRNHFRQSVLESSAPLTRSAPCCRRRGGPELPYQRNGASGYGSVPPRNTDASATGAAGFRDVGRRVRAVLKQVSRARRNMNSQHSWRGCWLEVVIE